MAKEKKPTWDALPRAEIVTKIQLKQKIKMN